MNEIIISTLSLPVICGLDQLAAPEPFFHADRVMECNVLICVTEGVIYVTEEGEDYEVRGGELLILKKGLRHWGKREIPRGTRWYYIHFLLEEPGEDRCREFTPDAGPIGAYEALALRARVPKKVSGLRSTPAQRELEELFLYSRSGDPSKRLRLGGMLHSLLTGLAMTEHEERVGEALSDRICAWLREHCREGFSAGRLEKEFFLSYKRLAAVFRQERGMTMQQYHVRCRMEIACRLLRSTLMPVREVALEAGYADPLYFSRVFSAVQGVSPSGYRQSAREDY